MTMVLQGRYAENAAIIGSENHGAGEPIRRVTSPGGESPESIRARFSILSLELAHRAEVGRPLRKRINSSRSSRLRTPESLREKLEPSRHRLATPPKRLLADASLEHPIRELQWIFCQPTLRTWRGFPIAGSFSRLHWNAASSPN